MSSIRCSVINKEFFELEWALFCIFRDFVLLVPPLFKLFELVSPYYDLGSLSVSSLRFLGNLMVLSSEISPRKSSGSY